MLWILTSRVLAWMHRLVAAAVIVGIFAVVVAGICVVTVAVVSCAIVTVGGEGGDGMFTLAVCAVVAEDGYSGKDAGWHLSHMLSPRNCRPVKRGNSPSKVSFDIFI